MNEFEHVGHSMEFPQPSIHEVASAVGNVKAHNMPSFESAASDIVQIKSKKVLLPLIEITLQRTSYVMKRLFTIAVDVIKGGEDQFDDSNPSLLASYDLFIADLQHTFSEFIEGIERDCKSKLIEDFSTFTKIVDWDLLNGIESVREYNFPSGTAEDTKRRVETLMGGPKEISQEQEKSIELERAFLRTRKIDQQSYFYICKMSAKLFAGIRFFFVKYIRNKLNAFFLDPMFQKLGSYLTEHFRKLTNEVREHSFLFFSLISHFKKMYEKMFDLGIKDLQNRLIILQKQYVQCKNNRDRFKEVCDKIRSNLNTSN